ncbi:MAG: protein translocase subunit SecDF [Daejeonella sp.]|nr:protein translocase subunit SecDF [Daejeonella sp.]
MQGKGLIKFAAIALTIACLYSLSFTWIAKHVESNAKEYAKGDIEKEKAYLDSVSTQPVFSSVKYITYQYAKDREIPLGLDLKGGMNVTMEISLTDLVKNLSNNNPDPAFNTALHNAETRIKEGKSDFISLFVEEYKQLKPNAQLAGIFATKENAEYLKPNSSNSEVQSFLKKQAKDAIDRSFIVLNTRIDQFGVVSPSIQQQEGTNRIMIELPGVSDTERIRKLLSGSAKLEFWETFDNTEIFPLFENVNKILASTNASTDTVKAAAIASNSTAQADSSKSKLAALGKKDSTKKDTSAALNKNLQDQAKQNPLFAILSPASYQNPDGKSGLRPGPVVGYAAQKDTAKVNKYFASQAVRSVIPSNVRLAWGVKPVSPESKVFELYALKANSLAGPALEGDVISDAGSDYDQKGNPEVTMRMTAEGSHAWRAVTAAASADPQNKKSIAIVLDNLVYSAPTVQNEIPNGVSSISGNFKIEDTKDLANVLKAGRLPAPAVIVDEAVVGPSLGEAAIHSGLLSTVIGLVVVLIFMVFYYNRAGTIANVAVIINVFFLLGVLASLGAVLTLPGIAGIVLTMGMAVDANVLIYERIREELNHGKTIRLAVTDGFKHALSSILDSQISTFLTGVILYEFGSGPIKGFATTLMIGIITSLFCSILISRLIFEWMLEKGWDIKVSNPWSSHTFKNANYAFVKNRFKFYIFSGLFILAGLISMFTRGFSLGVDFQGGRSYVVQFDKQPDIEQVRTNLNTAFGKTTEVKSFGSDNKLKITTTYLVKETDEKSDALVQSKLKQGLDASNNTNHIVSSQKVGPTVANDIKISAVKSVLFAIIIISIYIFIRFRKWQFSLGAMVATAHDALMVLSFFTLFKDILPFSLDIDQAFIAAILTVIGYSINDTVVVFDRIREFLNLHHSKADDPKAVINSAINSTLSRTIITALTVFFVLVVLFIFGGEVIRSFSFALLIGVVFGTYSSICVATPVIIDFGKKDLR